MRTSSVLAAFAAMLSPAMADFYIYAGSAMHNIDGSTVDDITPYAGPPDCNDVFNTVPLTGKDDVSGSKEGIRCKGCSSAYGGEGQVQVTELEMNYVSLGYGHWTFYADRGGDMVDLEGNVVGNCAVDGTDGYDCTDGMASYQGRSQLRCTSGLAIP